MELIGSTLREHMLRQPDKLAIISDEGNLTYHSLYKQVVEHQNTLLNLTGSNKKRIGLLIKEPSSFLSLFLAIVRIGWEAMPIDPKWTDEEFDHACNIGKPDVILTNSHRFCDDPMFVTLQDLKKGNNEEKSYQFSSLTDFYVGFTSGSTGKPKGFTRTHESWMKSFLVYEEAFKLSHENTIISPGPLCHSLSLFTAIHAIQLGATLHVSEFHRKHVAERLSSEGIDSFVGVPTMMEALMEELISMNKTNDSLRNIIISGAGWSNQSKDKAATIFPNATLYEYYGASELSFVMYKVGQAGGHQPFPTVRLKVLDENMKEVNKNEEGKLFIDSPMLFSGYIDHEEETNKVLTSYGATVGDIGFQNESGEVFIVGRESNMIKTGGLKVYPEEVEAILDTHPNILQSIVYPLKDSYWGEKVVCSILWEKQKEELTLQQIKSYCETKLSPYKIPKQIIKLPCFHYTKSGKIDRKATIEGRTFGKDEKNE
ncbi:AMP-binding protein [Rossellomorea aquimaris]|uniref:AMP-binding protein n=1 Tax=Rossellomorea aquimaris TaxID=189382 RepID=UPI0007D09BDE|nr:AMP-binding protein [Rossellomorea aquimaris]